ncbi:hypothetical protein ABIE41_003586 [Bosea sp. OAE506]|uniref:hypothetical protein n=1 Tax=Bosea sp. OAE506 TaxID=2663870 RepID=UPI00178A760F
MEVVLLIEFEAAAPGRAALLERVGALALTGRGRLSFLGTAPGESPGPGREVLAVGLARAAEASALVARWREEGALPADACVRHLAVQPLWSMEPLALMFP